MISWGEGILHDYVTTQPDASPSLLTHTNVTSLAPFTKVKGQILVNTPELLRYSFGSERV
jgi:hypothetical protein